MPRALDAKAALAAVAVAASGLPAAAAGAPGEWPAFGRDPSNRNVCELASIDRTNVARLRPARIFQSGVTGYFQTQPVMVEGTLYLSTTQNNVAALDARSGRLLWTDTHEPRTEKIFGPPSNRGVAVPAGGSSFTGGSGFGTGDALVVFALPD